MFRYHHPKCNRLTASEILYYFTFKIEQLLWPQTFPLAHSQGKAVECVPFPVERSASRNFFLVQKYICTPCDRQRQK